jgi:hypothetical protein
MVKRSLGLKQKMATISMTLHIIRNVQKRWWMKGIRTMTTTKFFAIFSLSEDGWWNNDDGWVYCLTDATLFNEHESLTYDLPDIPDAEWTYIMERRND